MIYCVNIGLGNSSGLGAKMMRFELNVLNENMINVLGSKKSILQRGFR